MEARCGTDITEPRGTPVGQSGGRTRYRTCEGEAIVRKDDRGIITHRMDVSKDRKRAVVRLDASLGSRLAEAEYIFTGMMFFEMALNEGYLPIHASAVDVGGHALLFSGPSTSGKSTQAHLWLKNRPDACTVLNDDKPLLFLEDGKTFVLGTPWSGKERKNDNRRTPVSHLLFIRKAVDNRLEPMTKHRKITEMMRNVVRPGHEEGIGRVTDLVSMIIDYTPMFRFHCTKNDDAYTFLAKQLGISGNA